MLRSDWLVRAPTPYTTHEILYFENINMNSYKIEGLADPASDGDAVNKKYLESETGKLLPLSGGAMTGQSNMGNKRIVDCGRLIMKRDGKSPIDLNLDKIIGLSNPTNDNDGVRKKYVDDEIAKIPTVNTSDLKLDGSRAMTGDLKMDSNHILQIKNVDDHKDTDPLSVRRKDLYSAVNKEYLNENFY